MKLFTLAALALLTFTTSGLLAQTTATQPNDPTKASLTGKWKVTWLNGGTPNKLQLTDTDGNITGTFAADGGDSCVVAGTTSAGIVSLQVTCAKFNIQMKGQLKEMDVTGNYVAYGNVSGEFKMEKIICWLPEGCGGQ